MTIAGFAIRNHRGILLAAVFICLLGGSMAAQMPAAILPDFPYPRLAIIVHAGDLAIQDVLVRVTRPLESAAAGVPGAKRVFSETARGAAEISVDFDWGTPMFEAYARLNALIASLRSQLPPEAEVQVEWIQPSIFPIIGISLSSDRSPPGELRDAALLTVAPYLSRLKGVYRANVLGGQVREYQVLVDPQALVSENVTIEQVSAALAASSLVRSVGRFNRQAQSFLVIVDTQVDRPELLLETVVALHGARPVRIRDLGRVREGLREVEAIVKAGYRDAQGRPVMREAVQVDVLKQPGASTAQVSEEVAAAIRVLRAQLPPGTEIRTFYDEAELLRESQASLRDSILMGGALAMLVLLVALRSWRSMGIVLLCLPITVLLAFICLQLLHQSLNLMTLGGLAVGLGLIIDDVVVTLENIYRHLEMGKPPLQAALDGSGEIQKPMIGSTLTTVAVFLPLVFVGEIIGGLFAPLSITLVILLLGSVLLAVTFVPIVCGLLLRPLAPARRGHPGGASRPGPPPPDEPHPPGAGATGPGLHLYRRLMTGALAAPWAVVCGALLLALCAAAAVRGLPSGLIPDMDEGAFVMDYLAPAGTPLTDTDRACRVMEDEIMATPEVEGFCRRTGLELGFFATDANRGDNMIRLKPRSERRRGMREVMEDVLARCRRRLPNVEFEGFPPIIDRVGDIAGEPSPVEVKIYGEDAAVLAELAEKVEGIFKRVRGVEQGAHEITPGGPELLVKVDPLKAGLLGLSPQQVAERLELELFGRVEAYAPRGDRLIGLRAVLPREARRTEAQIRRLPIYSKDGRSVALEEIAEVQESPGAVAVVRENQKQVLPVKGVVVDRDLGSANREVQERIASEIRLPPGYSIQYGGLYYTQQESFRNLFQVLVLGALLVYIVTLFQYNRFAEPTCLVVAGAFALVGVAFALAITRTPFNVSSFTGSIMVFGMVMTNGIVLMDTVRQHAAGGLPLQEAILRAGGQRLRPVLMTAAIAILTLLPLAFGIGSGAEMQQPLAIAVIGGLVVSPLFTLVLAPALLFIARRRKG